MANASTNFSRMLIYIVVAALIVIVAYTMLSAPDRRSTGERIGDAVDALPHGVDKAARELKSRTPGEKAGDAVKDVGDNIKDNSHQ